MPEFFLASLLLGAMAGIWAGLFGLGGGVVIVPILAWMLALQEIPEKLVMIMAIATSLATIIFTSVSSVYAHHRRGYVLWAKVHYLSIGIVLGVAAGTVTAERISAGQLRLIFALFLFYVSLQIWLQIKISPNSSEETQKTAAFDTLAGVVIGAISSILGIGGGTLTVPYLIYRRVPIKNAVATSSTCGFPIAVAATVSYVLLGIKHGALPEWSLGYIYLPAFFGITLSSVFTAPIGAKLAHILPAEKLKRYFALVLFLMAIKMLWH